MKGAIIGDIASSIYEFDETANPRIFLYSLKTAVLPMIR